MLPAQYVKGQYVISTTLKAVDQTLEQLRLAGVGRSSSVLDASHLEWEPAAPVVMRDRIR